ncbi:MAG: 4-(cytidine 5'-diphospho)-2-C-methyl-D-erythritol kinase [Pseudolabrys sp.]
MSATLTELAPATINLSLRVLRRRGDGYHDLDSLVAFADLADAVCFTPSDHFSLRVSGPGADDCGDLSANLILRAAEALAARVPGLARGTFDLDKQLPVAAGLGGGSSDAAAALRLLARANGIAVNDPRIVAAAESVGADVPVCLDPVARVMRGIGHDLGSSAGLLPLSALLVNPRVAVPTAAVFRALVLPADGHPAPPNPPAASAGLLDWLRAQGNDLETPARTVAPVIGSVLDALRALPGADLARMSGSGATCFALFPSIASAKAAEAALSAAQPHWWVRATTLR